MIITTDNVLAHAQPTLEAAEADLLTSKEFEQESKALLEEAHKRSWLSQSPRQLAARIPVSVFAMGSL